MAQAAQDVEQLMSDYEDLWNGDFSKLEVIAESVELYDPAVPDGKLHGREAFEAHLRETRAGFPDFHIAIEDILGSNEVVMLEWTMTGTHEGEFNEIPPTDREIELMGMSKVLLTDNKVTEDRIYYNRQEIFEQLGLTGE